MYGAIACRSGQGDETATLAEGLFLRALTINQISEPGGLGTARRREEASSVSTKTITKMTDPMSTLAMPTRVLVPGLGLDVAGGNAGVLLVAEHCLVSGRGNAEGTRVEAGTSRDWAMFVDGVSLSDERPTKAPKAVAAEAAHGRYAAVVGAGVEQEQQIILAAAAVDGAAAVRKQAFRGPGPWSERP
ncbi:hypothetical protein CG736_23065 [Kitasatospora sp. CB02891]|nr:hypothetical protein CG736_23065 [Kitasatospora sp. CB02891]